MDLRYILSHYKIFCWDAFITIFDLCMGQVLCVWFYYNYWHFALEISSSMLKLEQYVKISESDNNMESIYRVEDSIIVILSTT